MGSNCFFAKVSEKNGLGKFRITERATDYYKAAQTIPSNPRFYHFTYCNSEMEAEITENTCTFLSGEITLKGFVAKPKAEGPHPAVIVIHEIYGLNDNIRDITRRFAAAGYAAMALDLFAGRNKALCVVRLLGNMLRGKTDHFGTRELKAALSYFEAQPYVEASKVGAIGFCMGGGFAIAWAIEDERLKTIAPFYGTNPKPLQKVKKLCPTVGSYPEKDFTAKAGSKLNEELNSTSIPHDIKVYPGAKHSFMNDRGKAYDEMAATDAWNRTLNFFQQHLNH